MDSWREWYGDKRRVRSFCSFKLVVIKFVLVKMAFGS